MILGSLAWRENVGEGKVHLSNAFHEESPVVQAVALADWIDELTTLCNERVANGLASDDPLSSEVRNNPT